ncbi:hypothetical protein [Streptosporangium sp. KLBMP 9127]|nr:hypothetical protein [Streptosporangium sp. KLBMP 9127]
MGEGAVGLATLAVLGLVVAGPLLGRDERPPERAVAEPGPQADRAPVVAADAGRVIQEPAEPAKQKSPEQAKQEPEKQESAKKPAAKKAKPKKAKDVEDEASGESKHTDAGAVEYLRRTKDKASSRVKDVRSVGGYLRIYTDLPQSADNSSQAIELCQRGLRYLIEEQGVPDPVVFVQAEFGENGNPVIANILGPADENCRVTYPEPG